MKIGIVGSLTLTTEETQSVFFLLDSVLNRYRSDGNTLILGGREGVEAIAEKLAKRHHWPKDSIHYVRHNGPEKWLSFMRKQLDQKIAEECDILIAIEPKDFSANHAVAKTKYLGKVAWEIFV